MKPRLLRSLPKTLVVCFSSGLVAAAMQAQGAEALFSSGAFTSDATSGVSSAKTYTALGNVVGGNVIVNSTTFVGGTTSGTGWAITGIPTTFGSGGNHTTTFAGQAITGLFDGFQYGGNPGVITMSGLTVGKTYVSTLYCEDWSWPSAADRTQKFIGSEGGTFAYNPDALEASVLRYTFVATATTMTLTDSPYVAGNSFHAYGLSNEQVFNKSWVSGADWTTAIWNPLGAPNSIGANADFTSQGAPTTINLDANVTVGHVQFDGANAWTLSTNNSSVFTLQTDAGGVSVLSTPSGSHVIGMPIALNSNVMKSGAGTLAVTGAISGSKAITITGGILKFGATNSYTGATTVNSGATVDLNDTVQTLTALNGGGTVLNNGSSAVTLTLNAGTFSGVIADHTSGGGTVALTKTTSGTLTLTKASTYSGATVVNDGILRLEGSGSPMLTDNFTGVGTPDTNNVNYNIANRQTGSAATQSWTKSGNVQLGNPTDVRQPAGTTGDYLLLAFNGNATPVGMPLTSTNVTGPIKISFDMFKSNAATGAADTWASFTLRSGANNHSPNTVGSGEVGFLYRKTTGIQLFNNSGTPIADIASTTGGDSFSFYLTDVTGTGSPFSVDGTRLVITQGGNILGSWRLNASMSGNRYITFGAAGDAISGVDNLAVVPMQNNILPATTNLSLTTATSVLQLENVAQTVAQFDGVAGSTVSMGPLSNLIVNGSTASTFAGTITGVLGNVTKSGSGTLNLTGTNNYGGTTIFTGGIVNVSSLTNYGVDGPLGNRATETGQDISLLFRGGTLQYTGSTAQSTNRAIRISTTGGATLDASGSVPSATVSFTAATSPNLFEFPGARNLTLTGSNTGANTFNTALTDAGGRTGLNKNGVGTWVLTGANTYQGQTHINGGILRIQSSNGLGTGGFDGNTMSFIATNSTLEFSGNLTINEHFHMLGSGSAGQGAVDSVSGNSSLTTNFALDGDTTIGVDADTLSIPAQIYTETGTPILTKIGAGALVLSGNNDTITGAIPIGGVTVNGGSLTISGGAALPNSGAVTLANTAGVALIVNNNETIGSLAGGGATGGNVNIGANTLTVGGTPGLPVNTPTNFDGVISGTGGSLVKNGTGTFTLNGVNTYTGDTTVNDGILDVATNSASTFADTSTVTIGTFAQLNLPNAGTDVVDNLIVDGTHLANGVYDANSPETAGFITGLGKLQVVGASGYANWATSNVNGDAANIDTDLDGVNNGIEYFMNSAAGFTANPSIVSGAVTWPNGGNIDSAAYGTEFVVQTSPNLSTWTNVLLSDPNLSNTAGSLTYTLPTGEIKIFVRLVVTPQ